MGRDKVMAICDYASQTKCSTRKNYTDALSEKPRTSLSLYNKLANLQFERTV
ncbi:hypothetical protein [Clostridium autoethanogenum]|uniref:hypothetical protein n=1 Tax=Clostridium autoethanogenum TaxID=84023 RepID=UPI001604F311|nr:hypothetical protein [Clostridium autoethanogenum]